MLSSARLTAFAATARPDAARTFYVDVLGLSLVADTPFALVVDAHGTTLRIQKVPAVSPLPYTLLGWVVDDLEGTIDGLGAQGVVFRAFEGLEHDVRGIWTSPDGTRVAWFQDPDGNVLSLTAAG